MSTHESPQNQSNPEPRGKSRRSFRVSPMNTIFSMLFAVGGVVFWILDSWVTGLVFLVAACGQYGMALFARRGKNTSDLWRTSAFEPGDERDRAILTKASAIVAYVAGGGSMVAFLVVLLAFRSETVLVSYLALQTIAINLFWGLTIWVVARRG